jgi:hypothetical protein
LPPPGPRGRDDVEDAITRHVARRHANAARESRFEGKKVELQLPIRRVVDLDARHTARVGANHQI